MVDWKRAIYCSYKCHHIHRGVVASSKTHKTCHWCKRNLLVDSFYRNKNRDGIGVSSHCIECRIAISRKRRSEGRYLYPSKNYPNKKERPWFKNKAKYLVRTAIKNGRMVRMPCEICADIKVEAHHPDYNKPYDVKWLCKKHHAEEHRIKLSKE